MTDPAWQNTENHMVQPFADDDLEIMPGWEWAEDSEHQFFDEEQI